jgi:hypothetical protein
MTADTDLRAPPAPAGHRSPVPPLVLVIVVSTGNHFFFDARELAA